MDFEDERYVRLYTRDTPTYVGWHWHTRAVAKELMRKVDKDGRLEWPSMKSLCAALLIPDQRVVERGLREMVESGTIVAGDGWLHWPRFVPGQNTRSRAKTPAERTAEWKQKTGYKHRQESPGDDASPAETAEPPSDPPAIPQPSDPPASPPGVQGAKRKPKAPRQLDAQAELVLARVDEHRVRWGMPPIAASARTDASILARMRDGASVAELLAGVDARARKADRDVADRASLNATTPFTGPSANGPGGWSFTYQLLDRERTRGSSSPATETPEQRASRERYEQAKQDERAKEREAQRRRDLERRPPRPAAKEIPDDVA